MIDPPAVRMQQRRDAPIAVPPILTGKLDDGRGQRALIVWGIGLIPLGRPRLTQHPTSPTFRDAQRVAAVPDCLPTPRWA